MTNTASALTPISQGTTRTRPVALELGFASNDFGYAIDLGLPQDAGPASLFARDPEIKGEAVFAGETVARSVRTSGWALARSTMSSRAARA